MGEGHACGLVNHARSVGYTPDSLAKNLMLCNKNLNIAPFEDKDINILYNIADVNLTTSVGEGCGLSLLEASATKTTSIAPNNSAMPEQLGGSGHLIRNCGFVSPAHDNGFLRPVPHIPSIVDALATEYTKWQLNNFTKVLNDKAYKHIKHNHRWEPQRDRMAKAIKENI